MDEQPQQPWNPVPAPGGNSAIAVTAMYSWLAFVYAFLRPTLVINGHPVQTGWGRTVVPMPPGQHHVHIHVPCPFPSRIGVADTVVPVHPDQVVELEYRAPAIGWLPGSLGPAPQQYRGMAAGIALLALPLVMLLCICGGIGMALINRGDDEQGKPPSATGTQPTTAPSNGLPPQPTEATPQQTSGKPPLRPAPARTLVGPSFAPGDDTYTMSFAGWPFAFRTPSSWACANRRVDLAEVKVWVCVTDLDPDSEQRLQILVRPCPAPCGQKERAVLNADWFNPALRPQQRDPNTWYVETPRDTKGRYALDMSRFFPVEEPKWHVGVGVHSPPSAKSDVQKIVNDVLTQTS